MSTVEWRNEVGDAQWQPALPNGERLYYDPNRIPATRWVRSGRTPRLYRSQARAERVARREWRRVQRETWKEST